MEFFIARTIPKPRPEASVWFSILGMVMYVKDDVVVSYLRLCVDLGYVTL